MCVLRWKCEDNKFLKGLKKLIVGWICVTQYNTSCVKDFYYRILYKHRHLLVYGFVFYRFMQIKTQRQWQT